MKESKSELKVVLLCIVLIGANMLGLDLSGLLSPGGEQAAGAVDAAMKDLASMKQASKDVTLSGYVALLGGAYGAYRTIVKAVGRWVDGVLKEPEQ